tara:strand:- start:1031 stop:3784 length:2754 start_codon:yes stop_codon:yes gene_type:complete
MLFGVFSYAQTTVSGSITDQNNQPLSGATVIVVGTSNGVAADFDGNYTITVDMDTPFSIEASSVGFKPFSVEVNDSSTVNIVLQDDTALDEVVVSASRTPQRVFESPVTVERFGTKDIRTTASADFYDGLENLKGVDINVNSFTFKSINTRGFATFANTRFVQLVDGMDNSAPALNFPLGNLLGMVETDVLDVELVPGTSSALYGANAFNGILLMRSKNPFDHQGISGQYKRGVTVQDAAGTNEFQDLQIRWGHKFSDKLAMKVNFGYLNGTDWIANSEEDKLNRAVFAGVYNKDGINIYGDEVQTNIYGVAQAMVGLGLLPAGAEALVPSTNVSRTGYNETDMAEPDATSKKADWGVYYRPVEGSNLEISYVGKWGTGKTLYQGINRYAIKNFLMTQHKLEVTNDNWFARAYVVEDDAGDSYDMTFAAINVNRRWKPDLNWFAEYVGGIVNGQLSGMTIDQAHVLGRQIADTGRWLPGSEEFNANLAEVIQDPDLTTGARFTDNSKFYHLDYNYNFGHMWDWAEVQVGGSARRYSLNSGGTIFTDVDGPIEYQETGFYTQAVKKMMDERLVVTGAIRFDKSEYFDGQFSPRAVLSYTAGEYKNLNFRVSYQTGFRTPTTQDLFIGLDAGQARLVGSAEGNPERYVRDYAVSTAGQALGVPATVTITGASAYNNAYEASSVQAFAAAGDPSLLRVADVDYVKPEQMQSMEFGFRGKLSRTFTVDAAVYRNDFQDFINTQVVLSPLYGEVGDGGLSILAMANQDFETWSSYTNSPAEISSWGISVGAQTKIFGNFDLSASYTKAKLEFEQELYPDFRTNWNTPEHKFKAQFGNTELFKNFGFNVAWRYWSEYLWQASFGDGMVPETHVIDAQINLTVPKWKSTIKVGATNLGGDEYFTAFGSGFIGTQYYISWTANNF